MVLDLDTAYLYHCDNKHSRGKTCTVLNPRCVSCSAQKGFTRFLTQHGLLCEPDQKHCRHRACLRPPFAGSLFCNTHLFRCVRDVPDHVGSTAVTSNSVPLDLLQETLKKALSRRWSCGPFKDVLHRRERLSKGESSGVQVACLDLEFSPTTGKVFEIGICEYFTGKVLMDTAVEHGDRPASRALHQSLAVGRPTHHPFMEMMSRRIASKIYSSASKKFRGRLNVYEIASQLREAGITPQTIFLTWHQSTTDFIRLRDLLEQEGYTDILQSNERCFPMIPSFKKNLHRLPGNKPFPVALEVLFPLLFPKHELVGRNHRALVDALQLRLVATVFEEQCKLPKDRDPNRLVYKHGNT